jgi:hypothetical protein
MDRVIVVEVLAGAGRGGWGRVVERVRLAQLPAVIGRGYASDVILDDRFVDAAHARLSLDGTGAIVVEDLGSANGTREREHAERAERLVLRPGATFRVGHTTLRVVTSDLAVPPPLREAAPSGMARWAMRRPQLAGWLSLVGAPLFALAFYQSDIDQISDSDYEGAVVLALALVAAWAGVWALVTRLRTGRARFGAHLAMAWLVLGLALAGAVASDWLRFLAADSATAEAVTMLIGVASFTVVVYGHLAIASRLPRGRRALTSVVTALLLLAALSALSEAGLADDGEAIAIAMPLKPAPLRWVPSESAEAFLARVAKLQQVVDGESRR